MIKKTASGYMVTSEEGKPLSKPNLSHAEAVKRLSQIEFYKHHTARRAAKKKS